MARSYTKEQSTYHAPREEKPKKERKPIKQISDKRTAVLKESSQMTAQEYIDASKSVKKRKRLDRLNEKKKSNPLTVIKKDLDTILSLVVKMEPANSEGYFNCYCGKSVHWLNGNNSHYLSRAKSPSLVFDRMNVNPSCIRCNGFLEGNLHDYTPWMEKKYGKDQVELLRLRGQQKSNNGAFEYQIMLQEYIKLFLIQCKRLNHTPTKTQQKIIDKYGI